MTLATAKDVHRGFSLYGPPVCAVRGKHTDWKATSAQVVPELKKMTDIPPVMYSDIVMVMKFHFLVSLVEPLGLVLSTVVAKTSSRVLGAAQYSHFSWIQRAATYNGSTHNLGSRH